MKYFLLIPLAAIVIMANGHAQSRIFRCGNSYTNNATEAQDKSCKAIEGTNVTIVEGTRVNIVGTPARVAGAAATVQAAGQPSQRVDLSDQRARDADARLILSAELKKAEARQVELAKEFNNGEPDKLGPETRNYQKYLDRVAELKASITRNDNDIAGIKRELGRAPASK